MIKVLTTNRFRYMKWFMSKYFTPPENASFIIPDVIRYICCVIYPTNKILQSPIVPRCIIIMDFIRAYQVNIILFHNHFTYIYAYMYTH